MLGETLARIAKAGDSENIQRWCALVQNQNGQALTYYELDKNNWLKKLFRETDD